LAVHSIDDEKTHENRPANFAVGRGTKNVDFLVSGTKYSRLAGPAGEDRKHPKAQPWLARHPRFRMHFIPISSPWMNLVERRFRDLTDKRLRRVPFRSVPQLIAAIEDYIEHPNNAGKRFQWTAKADVILDKVRRARAKLDKISSV